MTAKPDPPNIDRPMVLGVDEHPTEIVQNRSLFVLSIVGSVLVVLAVLIALRFPDVNSFWSTLALQFGSTILLFAVLFYIERRFVRRVIHQTADKFLRALQPHESNEDLAERVSRNPNSIRSGAALIAARDAFSALVDGRFVELWASAEANWRLCRAQAWVWNNRLQLKLSSEEQMQSLAEDLSQLNSEHPLWSTFLEIERQSYLKTLSNFRPGEWGVATGRRCVGPGYELFQFSRLSGEFRHGLEVLATTIMPDSTTLLMHLSPQGWKVAATGAYAPPQPGWPPAFWAVGDPAAEEATIELEREAYRKGIVREPTPE